MRARPSTAEAKPAAGGGPGSRTRRMCCAVEYCSVQAYLVSIHAPKGGPLPRGFSLVEWDGEFTEALWRLVQLGQRPSDAAVLGDGRRRELYCAVLKGEAGAAARRA